MSEVQLAFEQGDMCIATCGGVLVTCVGESGVSLEFLEAAREAGRSLGTQYPNGIGSLTFVQPIVTLPPAEIRAAAAALTEASNAWVSAGATLVQGSGFRTAAVRSVLTAITLFEKGPPRKVFDDPRRATAWLLEQVDAPEQTGEAIIAWARQRGLLAAAGA